MSDLRGGTVMARALSISPDGSVSSLSIRHPSDIKEHIDALNFDHDTFANLGVSIYYDYGTDRPVNVFPSFISQGFYAGTVVVVGDLDRHFNRSDKYEDLPTSWFAESLARIIALANSDPDAVRAVEANRP